MSGTGQNVRSILPGLSWNQYWFFGSLTRASNFLGHVSQHCMIRDSMLGSVLTRQSRTSVP